MKKHGKCGITGKDKNWDYVDLCGVAEHEW